MKICLISFDFWQYDAYIVDVLCKKGIKAHHINLGAYQHKNFSARLKNTFSKLFLKRNLKNELRQKLILDVLSKIGKQDQILIINPEVIEREYHQEIKKYTNRYIAFLYDSLSRNPAEHVLDFFDIIFSFDRSDSQKHGFEHITNYNYLNKNLEKKSKITTDLYYITSFDPYRNKILISLAKKLKKENITFNFEVVGKRTWKENLKFLKEDALKNFVKLRRKPISTSETLERYKSSKAILDLMRSGQSGLSFRIFEAMALEKKIITNNPDIKNYDFYNPENILILEDDFSNLSIDFFEKPYQKLDKEIFHKYTLDYWVEKVFNIQNGN